MNCSGSSSAAALPGLGVLGAGFPGQVYVNALAYQMRQASLGLAQWLGARVICDFAAVGAWPAAGEPLRAGPFACFACICWNLR
jgi:hypothetical protein